jgi:hypothetical protein
MAKDASDCPARLPSDASASGAEFGFSLLEPQAHMLAVAAATTHMVEKRMTFLPSARVRMMQNNRWDEPRRIYRPGTARYSDEGSACATRNDFGSLSYAD